MSSDNIVEAHVACPLPDCGSSDGFTWYEDHGFCFVCRRRVRGGKDGETGVVTHSTPSTKSKDLIEIEQVRALERRRLYRETCEKYGYGMGRGGDGKLNLQVAPYRNQKGQLVAQKIRNASKEFRTTGDFKDVQLFGQHLWKTGGKRLVITEGEIDAMSAHQMLSSWAVVSVPNGAQGAVKSIKTNLEFVESYDTVILCFDQDDPGRAAAQEVAELLPPGKVRIMELPEKDASDMLMENRVDEFTKCFWEARAFQPDGIINGTDIWDLVNADPETGRKFPWSGLTDMTFGMRAGELYTWTSGSGMGKSEFVAEVAFSELMDGQRVGYIALEESCGKTGQRMMAKYLNKPIHLPGHEASQEEKQEAFKATTGNGRLYLYDHWGSQDIDRLLSKMRFMIKAYDVDVAILDHLSIIVSGIDDGDERKTIDVLMTALRSLVEETGVRMHLVSHLRRPKGDRGHEGGEQVTLAQLRGSHSIVQLSDFVFGLERNQQSKDKSDVTRIRVLKNRYSGTTGMAAAVKYDHETGRLNEVPLDDEETEDQTVADFSSY